MEDDGPIVISNAPDRIPPKFEFHIRPLHPKKEIKKKDTAHSTRFSKEGKFPLMLLLNLICTKKMREREKVTNY